MITLLVAIALFATGWVLMSRARCCSRKETVGELLSIVGGVLVFTLLALCSVVRFVAVPIEIQKHRSVRQTVERARADGETLEDAALQQKVVEQNRWLAEQKWWRESDVWYFIPPEIEEVEPIE